MAVKILAVGGDSHSDYTSSNGSVTYGHNLPERTWPTLLKSKLAAITGDRWRENNVAKGGATSLRMAQFSDDIFYVGQPEITVLYSAANDLGAGLTPAELVGYVQACAMMAMYECMGAAFRDAQGYWTNTGRQSPFVFVANVAALPLNGRAGQRFVVLADSRRHGRSARQRERPGAAPDDRGRGRAGGAAVWECRNARAGAYGYGRVALPGVTAPWACKKVLIASSPYLNFHRGGDTPSVEKSTLVAVRRAVEGVATTTNVPVATKPSVVSVNLYELARARIVADLDFRFLTVAYDDNVSLARLDRRACRAEPALQPLRARAARELVP